MTSKGLLYSTAASIVMLSVSPAAAQEVPINATPDQEQVAADGGLGEIVVTARRRNETLQSVPLAVTALSSARIERDGVENIADVAKLTSSLVFDKFFGPQDNRPTIRGLPSTRGRPPVGILIDGIDVSTESIATSGGGNLMDLRLVDFERIEVVKGPQSALYGRAAFGGAINYVLREPGSELGGYVSGEVGLYDRYQIRGAIDLPVSETLSYRVNGAYSYFGGFYRNSTTGNRIGGYESAGGALTTKWQPSSDVKIIGRISYARNEEQQQATKYYGVNNGLAINMALPATAAGKSVGTSVLPMTVTSYRPGNIENEAVPVALSPDPADPTGKSDYPGAETDTWIGSLRGEFELGFATLSTWTGFTRSNGTTIVDVDFFGRPYTQVALPAPGGLGEYSGSAARNGLWQFDITTKIKQFSQEVRLSDLSGGPFRWAIGGLIWNEDVDQLDRRFTSYGLGAGASVSLNVALQGGRSTVAGVQGRETRHLSGYAVAEFDITPQIEVSLEGRYAREKLSYVFGRTVGIATGTNLANGPAPFVLTGSDAAASSTTNYFTPRGIISWKPADDILIYASAARGIKPGGFAQVGNADPNLGRYRPERMSNYELGAKTTLFDRRLRLNGAYFHMDYKDKLALSLVQVPLTVSPIGQLTVTNNAGGAKVDGFELEFSGLITRELVLSGGYTYLNPRYTDYVFNSTTALTIARAGNCTVIVVAGATTCQLNQSDRTLEAAPRHVATGTLTWTKPLGDGARLIVEGAGQYRGKRYLEDTNTWAYKPFAMFDAKVGLEKDGWSLTAYVDNVFNNQTIKSAISVNDIPSGVVGQQIIVAYAPDPRTAGLRFKADF